MHFEHTSHGLLVDDINKAVEFYSRNLGYKVIRQSYTFAEMDTGGLVESLFFWQYAHIEEHLGKEAMSKVKHRTQSAIRFEKPGDVDRAYEELKAKGVNFLVAPANWEWNARAAYFVDGDGYMWELFCWQNN